jgi:hypothetical protein
MESANRAGSAGSRLASAGRRDFVPYSVQYRTFNLLSHDKLYELLAVIAVSRQVLYPRLNV